MNLSSLFSFLIFLIFSCHMSRLRALLWNPTRADTTSSQTRTSGPRTWWSFPPKLSPFIPSQIRQGWPGFFNTGLPTFPVLKLESVPGTLQGNSLMSRRRGYRSCFVLQEVQEYTHERERATWEEVRSWISVLQSWSSVPSTWWNRSFLVMQNFMVITASTFEENVSKSIKLFYLNLKCSILKTFAIPLL